MSVRVCPNCGESVEVSEGARECPACHEVAEWSKRKRKPDAPPGLMGPYYAIAAVTIGLCFVPGLGLFALPAAIGTLAFGLYIRYHFRTYGAFAVCQFAVLLAGLAGYSFAERADIEANRAREVERRR